VICLNRASAVPHSPYSPTPHNHVPHLLLPFPTQRDRDSPPAAGLPLSSAPPACLHRAHRRAPSTSRRQLRIERACIRRLPRPSPTSWVPPAGTVLLPRPSARRRQATAPLPGHLHLRRVAMVLIRPPARCRGPPALLPRPPARRLPRGCAAMATSTGRHHPLPLRRSAQCLDGTLRHRRVDSHSTSRCPSGFFSPASPSSPCPPVANSISLEPPWTSLARSGGLPCAPLQDGHS
jgi:hypothetical protein